jgi:hypothetical protein
LDGGAHIGAVVLKRVERRGVEALRLDDSASDSVKQKI